MTPATIQINISENILRGEGDLRNPTPKLSLKIILGSGITPAIFQTNFKEGDPEGNVSPKSFIKTFLRKGMTFATF
jgi:hypothetical protein